MRVVVIGATGHIGTYLVPRLVGAGHEVIAVSRESRNPYHPHAAWAHVKRVSLDRSALEKEGAFGSRIAALGPDAVVDLIGFTVDSTRPLVEALRGRIQHFLHCGTIWVHGPSVLVPTTEDQPRAPFGDYGVHKAAIEAYLLREARVTGFPATILHPGHIVGPGWAPLNPAGHFSLEAFRRLATGEELVLPNFGLETVHHVHADDVAQAFFQALHRRNESLGESFHVVSSGALTLRGYAHAVAAWFGHEARLTYRSWESWRSTVTPEEAQATWDHIEHSPNCSTEKARRLLDYRPRSSLEAVFEALEWLIAQGQLPSPRR